MITNINRLIIGCACHISGIARHAHIAGIITIINCIGILSQVETISKIDPTIIIRIATAYIGVWLTGIIGPVGARQIAEIRISCIIIEYIVALTAFSIGTIDIIDADIIKAEHTVSDIHITGAVDLQDPTVIAIKVACSDRQNITGGIGNTHPQSIFILDK